MTRQARSLEKLSCLSLANSLVSAGSYTSSTDSDLGANGIDSVNDMRFPGAAGVFLAAVDTYA
jgi:hypothetical protein